MVGVKGRYFVKKKKERKKIVTFKTLCKIFHIQLARYSLTVKDQGSVGLQEIGCTLNN